MAVIKAQQAPKKQIDPEETLALLCYYYPAYTFKTARQLPEKRVTLMLKVAMREQAKERIELAKIVAAPHTNKGQAVKKLIEYYKHIAEK